VIVRRQQLTQRRPRAWWCCGAFKLRITGSGCGSGSGCVDAYEWNDTKPQHLPTNQRHFKQVLGFVY